LSGYKKTIIAAGNTSRGLKDLAVALWEEIPAKRGTVAKGLEDAQEALASAGFVYAVSRLAKLRQVAGWVAESSYRVKSPNNSTWRDVSYSVHEECYKDGLPLEALDEMIEAKANGKLIDVEGELVDAPPETGPTLVVDDLRFSVGKEPTRPRTDLDRMAEDEDALVSEIADSSDATVEIVDRKAALEHSTRRPVAVESLPPKIGTELLALRNSWDDVRAAIDSLNGAVSTGREREQLRALAAEFRMAATEVEAIADMETELEELLQGGR